MNKYEIISLKKKGISNREIAKQISVDRKTVAKIWKEYQNMQISLTDDSIIDPKKQDDILNQLIDKSYNTSNRKKSKLTDEVIKRINQINEFEEEKTKLLGANHKQKLSATMTHQILLEEGYDIGLSSVTTYLRNEKARREVFIRQTYEYGQRLEYDFGEIKLIVNGVKKKYYLAVLAAPASGFRWAYMYDSQDQKVFFDSHVQFFKMIQGSYKEVVYDNMRNVVTKFIGRNEKELNKNLINLALYYDFEINVTNCFSGNEKGYVEGSVKTIRNKVFTKKYMFNNVDDAKQHLNDCLIELNKGSQIEEEKLTLTKARTPYELAELISAKVNKYGCIRVENNFYSVPDYLMDKELSVKVYYDKLCIYSNNEFVCEHKKIDGKGQYQLDITHFLKTFKKKPGAINNSTVLNSYPQLKSIYNEYYKTKPKEFIDILIKYKDNSIESIIDYLKMGPNNKKEKLNKIPSDIEEKSKNVIYMVNELLKTRS